MSEWALVWIVPIRLSVVLVFGTLYAIGGRGPKWVRRFAGGIFLGAAVIGLSVLMGSFKWWLTALPVAYVIALSVGYGGDTLLEKISRRAIYGLGMGICALLAASATGVWPLAALQIGIALSASVLFAFSNPVSAVNEEALLATVSIACVPFMV